MREAGGGSARKIPAANHQIGVIVGDERDHLRKDGLLVLEVPVHQDEHGRGRGEEAFNGGRGETVPADAPNTSNTAVVRGLMLHRFPCSVGRVVIDENDLPVEGLQDSLDGGDERLDIVGFVQRGHDD